MSGTHPKQPRDEDGLTDQERLFLDAYLTNGFDRTAAMKSAGYSYRNPSQQGAIMLNKPHIVKALGKALEKRRNKFFVNEQDVLEGLYKEATLDKRDGGTQQGRIQAWGQIGKALGMFDQRVKELEKKAAGGPSGGTQIKIINYNMSPQQQKDEKVIDIEVEAAKALKDLPPIQDNDNEDED